MRAPLRLTAAFLRRLVSLRVTGYGLWVGDTAGGLLPAGSPGPGELDGRPEKWREDHSLKPGNAPRPFPAGRTEVSSGMRVPQAF